MERDSEAARGIRYEGIPRPLTPVRGFFGIGVYSLKNWTNLGGLWRSAYSLGASYIFTVCARYKKQNSDTVTTPRLIPYFRFRNADDFLAHIPYDCQLIAVELGDFAKPLESYPHPPRAVYILGPEDGSLPRRITEKAQAQIQFESRFCLNVATAGAIVMYDRRSKLWRRKRERAGLRDAISFKPPGLKL